VKLKPSLNCTQEEVLTALNECLPTRWSFLDTTEHGLYVRFVNRPPDTFGLGNHLGQYFHNLGIAQLAGIGYNVTNTFNVSGFFMPRGFPPSSPPDCSQASMLKHYCSACNRNRAWEFPHGCPGPWMETDMRGQLLQAIARAQPAYDQRDVVLQFRCSDSWNRPGYGMLPWMYYKMTLSDFQRQSQSSRFTVTIIKDPGVERVEFCQVVLGVLVRFINSTFQCDIEVRAARSLLVDVNTMLHANAFISGVSSLGMFVGAARHRVTYMPVSVQAAHKKAPCIGNVRWFLAWIWVGMQLHGDSQRAIQELPRWFGPQWQKSFVIKSINEVLQTT
jgi:hypothetical protein